MAGGNRLMDVPGGHTLTAQVMHDLGQAIVTGTYGPHNPLPIEADLGTYYGVSRSILREAIKMLSSKGLLASRPRLGTWVQSEQHWNLLDPDVLHWLLERPSSRALLVEFLEIRLAIEPMAALMAARQGTDAAIAAIGAALDRMRAAERGADDPLDSDIAFHVAILRASGNRFYAQMQDVIGAALRTSIRITNATKGVTLASIADHARVYDAIAARDGDAAAALMQGLISESIALARGDGTAL